MVIVIIIVVLNSSSLLFSTEFIQGKLGERKSHWLPLTSWHCADLSCQTLQWCPKWGNNFSQVLGSMEM